MSEPAKQTAFDKYWEAVVAKNPALMNEDVKMTITVASFKRQMQQAYERGKAVADNTNKIFESMANVLGARKP